MNPASVVPQPDPAGVVVLGSGLIDGRVPPLLASRLDRGADALTRRGGPEAGLMIVPSGGQGPGRTAAGRHHRLPRAPDRPAVLSDRDRGGVIGAPTARYSVPSAFIREFVAVLRMHLRLQIMFAVLGVGLASLTGGAVALSGGM